MDEPTTATLTRPAPAETPAPADSLARRLWRSYVTDVRADANARAETTDATDRKMVVVFVTSAIALTGANFLSTGAQPQWLETTLRGIGLDALANRLDAAMRLSTHSEWNRLAFWAIVVISCYVVPAVLVIRFVFRERVRDYGLRIAGVIPHARIYAVIFAIAAPLVITASFTDSFQARYPFYQPGAGESFWPYLYLWWGLYFAQFCALEFFFRGFMVHGLAPRLGWASIFAMAVPYNMIHYGKPMPEALAAIVGAIVLGSLSLKFRSIWPGAALHIAIALTMDLCALTHLGRL